MRNIVPLYIAIQKKERLKQTAAQYIIFGYYNSN